jgi:hypothetical protein
MPNNTSEIENNFTYHAPSPEDIANHEKIREAGKELALLVYESCPGTAERTLAIRKIEEAVMWANAAIARYDYS